MSSEFNRSEVNGDGPTSTPTTVVPNGSASGSVPTSPAAAPTSVGAYRSSGGATNGALPKAVNDVMYSDIGVATLLNRLKQSIASARDFASFLSKRGKLEEEQANGLRRLANTQLETLKRSEVKTGSYAAQLAEVMRVHLRMADNGIQFALSLSQMHEDLNELSANMERGRKQWKHEGLDAEKRASDAEAAMHKAKTRYDGLAEDYDRARTGDTKGSRRLGLKGPKSAEQYESDLLRKTQQADQDYEERVKQAKSQRQTLISSERPKAVSALQQLIQECDSALTLQLQKFATFNEKLLLGNGLAVSPQDKASDGQPRSLTNIIREIDNDTDFNSYMRGHLSKIPNRPGEIKYEQHPTLMPKTQKPTDTRNASTAFSQTPTQQQPSLSLNTASAAPGAVSNSASANSRYSGNTSQPPQSSYSQPPSSYGQSPSGGYGEKPYMNTVQSPTYGGPPPQLQQPSYNSSSSRDMFSPSSFSKETGAAAPPYPTHPSERAPNANNPYPPQQTTGSISSSSPAPPRSYGSPGPMSPSQQQQHHLPPLRPVFGVSLDELFARDQSAVPMVVIQCILAVDTFGLDVEGIYRLSGTASHIATLKSQFDHNASQIDFRNPANFYHDVNSVATLLKQFFRDLPDPLFTRVGYQGFVEAARIEDPEQRRDALHQNINDLPDPNYATLRALVLHMHRVMLNEGRNRMGASNLALCFAPSLMGQHTGGQIADASLQARVVDTILVNATAIFDED
ncbi:Rho GTPase-activating protein [Saxophila tyrrhenica]|uniref:Rho GTPase-activating protein n=1 Tax=Saxophila tyrrhenica TaxID=1690608 RepID=A0AAV9NW89_9PEZI|nr:Rho GTPase-activating protein [Saxophila tyrrhenica]